MFSMLRQVKTVEKMLNTQVIAGKNEVILEFDKENAPISMVEMRFYRSPVFTWLLMAFMTYKYA